MANRIKKCSKLIPQEFTVKMFDGLKCKVQKATRECLVILDHSWVIVGQTGVKVGQTGVIVSLSVVIFVPSVVKVGQTGHIVG